VANAVSGKINDVINDVLATKFRGKRAGVANAVDAPKKVMMSNSPRNFVANAVA
jgi:hypothetical protein